MPYIKKEYREKLDPMIDALIDELRKTPIEELDGQVNYVIFRLLLHLYPPRYFKKRLRLQSSYYREHDTMPSLQTSSYPSKPPIGSLHLNLAILTG